MNEIIIKNYKISKVDKETKNSVLYSASNLEDNDDFFFIKEYRDCDDNSVDADILSKKEKYITHLLEGGNNSVVVPVLERFEEDNKKYIVFQKKNTGKFLDDIIKLKFDKKHNNDPSKVKLALSFIRIILNAVRNIHSFTNSNNTCSVLHLDIHPGNIFIENYDMNSDDLSECKVKFIDFANSVLKENGEYRYTDVHSCTFHYSAHEVVSGELDSIGVESDLFSICAILCRMLTKDYIVNEMGESNYIDSNLERILNNSVLNTMLKRIIERGLYYDSKYRYHTADEMIKDIDNYTEYCNYERNHEYLKCAKTTYGFALHNADLRKIEYDKQAFIRDINELNKMTYNRGVDYKLIKNCYEMMLDYYDTIDSPRIDDENLLCFHNAGIAAYNYLNLINESDNCCKRMFVVMEKNNAHIDTVVKAMLRIFTSWIDIYRFKDVIDISKRYVIWSEDDIAKCKERGVNSEEFERNLAKLYSIIASAMVFDMCLDNVSNVEVSNNKEVIFDHYKKALILINGTTENDSKSKDYDIRFTFTRYIQAILTLIDNSVLIKGGSFIILDSKNNDIFENEDISKLYEDNYCFAPRFWEGCRNVSSFIDSVTDVKFDLLSANVYTVLLYLKIVYIGLVNKKSELPEQLIDKLVMSTIKLEKIILKLAEDDNATVSYGYPYNLIMKYLGLILKNIAQIREDSTIQNYVDKAFGFLVARSRQNKMKYYLAGINTEGIIFYQNYLLYNVIINEEGVNDKDLILNEVYKDLVEVSKNIPRFNEYIKMNYNNKKGFLLHMAPFEWN
ncbi:MAG: hypothetical protein K6F77_10590 [Lachnospiraceae bacterium]|nr:hypothetical protein [Lachnospiraceae bacterium]